MRNGAFVPGMLGVLLLALTACGGADFGDVDAFGGALPAEPPAPEQIAPGRQTATQASPEPLEDPEIVDDPGVAPQGGPATPTEPSQPPGPALSDIRKFKAEYPSSWVDLLARFLGKAPSELDDNLKINPSFLPPPNNNTGKKRHLIIGDSISLCYTPYVVKNLASHYEVHRVPHNGANTEFGASSLARYLQAGPWDLVTVNWGLHDLKYSEGKPQPYRTPIDLYEGRLRSMLTQIKNSGANVVWVRTTPTRNHPLHRPEDVVRYNARADEVTAELQIPRVDLQSSRFQTTPLQFKPDSLHFEAASCASFGSVIEKEVRALGLAN